MKNAIVTTLSRLIRPSVVALLFISLLGPVSAQATDKSKEVPVEVKYLGNATGKPLFQITFSNPLAEDVTVTLRDETGYVIYSDVSKEKNYARRLQFNELEAESLKLTLTLRTKTSTQNKTFEITKSTRTIEDVAVVML